MSQWKCIWKQFCGSVNPTKKSGQWILRIKCGFPKYYVYYDNVVPTGTIKGTSGTLSSGSYTNKAFSYSATDSGSGINYLQYKKPGSSTWTSYTSGTTIPATSTNAWYYFRAYDNAGNVSAESSVCLDTAVPTGTVYKETTSEQRGTTQIIKKKFCCQKSKNQKLS